MSPFSCPNCCQNQIYIPVYIYIYIDALSIAVYRRCKNNWQYPITTEQTGNYPLINQSRSGNLHQNPAGLPLQAPLSLGILGCFSDRGGGVVFSPAVWLMKFGMSQTGQMI